MDNMGFVENFELSLLGSFDVDQIKFISNQLLFLLKDYDVVKKSTELIVYDTGNLELLGKYASCLVLDGKSPKTVKQYVREIRLLAEFFGNRPLAELDVESIRIYLASFVRQGTSKCTINNYRNYISAFYHWMHREHLIDINPCEMIPAVKFKRKVKVPFSEVDIDKLRSACSSIRNRAIMEVLLSSGIRVSELCNLDIDDIDLTSYRVVVHDGKGGKDRVTYINKVAAFHLTKYLNIRKHKSNALFVTYPNRDVVFQDRLDPDAVRKMFSTLGYRAGVPKVHPHKFRRTFATTMYNKGMDLHQIQMLLGHDSIDTTLGYITSNDDGLAIAHHKFSA